MEKEKNHESYRTHRVGSVTAGLCMIGFGILLLSHSLFDAVSYEMIFSLWPLILVGLGIELLISNFAPQKVIYDKAAVFLMILMTFFSIGMAAADICLQVGEMYIGCHR